MLGRRPRVVRVPAPPLSTNAGNVRAQGRRFCADLAAVVKAAGADQSGTVDVAVILSDIVLVEFLGHVPGSLVTRAIAAVDRELEGATARQFVIDATGVKGYSPDVRQPGVRLLECLARHGAKSGAGVTSSSSIRMIASAMAAPVRLEFFPTRDRAIRKLLAAREGSEC